MVSPPEKWEIWIPRGFGSLHLLCMRYRLENDDVECWEPNPRTPRRGFGSLADLDPDSQRIVEDLFQQVSMSLAHSD